LILRRSGSYIASNDITSTGGLFYIAKLLGIISIRNSTFYKLIGIGSLLTIEEISGDILINDCKFISNLTKNKKFTILNLILFKKIIIFFSFF
jgi:hypothetical protein